MAEPFNTAVRSSPGIVRFQAGNCKKGPNKIKRSKPGQNLF